MLDKNFFKKIRDNSKNNLTYKFIFDEKKFNDLLRANYKLPVNTRNIKDTYGYVRDFMKVEKIEGYIFLKYSTNICKENKKRSQKETIPNN